MQNSNEIPANVTAKMQYSLYLLLKGGVILGKETHFIPVRTRPYDTIKEVVEQNDLLSFVTEADIKILEGDVNRGIEEGWSLADFGELGGIWCCEDDGLDYIFNSNAMDIEGVYAIAVICVF